MNQVPVVTIFVRHSADCSHKDDQFHKRCACWKHLRWFQKGKQHYRPTKQTTWAAAERAKAELLESFKPKDAKAEAIKVSEQTTIEDAIGVFIRNRAGIALVKREKLELERFRSFARDFQHKYLLGDITIADLVEFRADWPSWYPSTITQRNVQTRLKTFFRFCLRAGYIATDPSALLTTIKITSAPTMPLEPEECKRLLAATRTAFTGRYPQLSLKMHAFVRCMRYTGLAITDTSTLRRDAIIYDKKKKLHRVITRRTKTGTPVSVPIPPDVASELLNLANEDPRYVFWDNRKGGKVSSVVKHYDHLMRKVFRAAGLENGHSHQLRDTFAVAHLQAGVSIENVSKLLGHSSIRITEKHYAPWVKGRQDHLDDAVVATWSPDLEHTLADEVAMVQ